jgi:hypothetical protein
VYLCMVFLLVILVAATNCLWFKSMLQEPNRSSNRSTPKTGTGKKPVTKNTQNIQIFEKQIHIHVHPCESKPLYTNLQSFSYIFMCIHVNPIPTSRFQTIIHKFAKFLIYIHVHPCESRFQTIIHKFAKFLIYI